MRSGGRDRGAPPPQFGHRGPDIVLDFEAIEDQRLEEAARLQAAELTAGSAEDVAPSLRVAVERGLAQKLAPILEEAKRRKEQDIEQLCHRYHGGYLDSVAQLVQTRGEAGALRESVVAMNGALQESGGRVLA